MSSLRSLMSDMMDWRWWNWEGGRWFCSIAILWVSLSRSVRKLRLAYWIMRELRGWFVLFLAMELILIECQIPEHQLIYINLTSKLTVFISIVLSIMKKLFHEIYLLFEPLPFKSIIDLVSSVISHKSLFSIQYMCHSSCLTCIDPNLFTSCASCVTGKTFYNGACFCNDGWSSLCTSCMM